MASRSRGFFGLVGEWDVKGVCVGVADGWSVSSDAEGEGLGGFASQ